MSNKIKNRLIIAGIAVMFAACQNKENEFFDFDYTSVYFPLQTPVRTLSLGDDRVDNSLDKELKFNIGVSIGGLYTNTKNWSVTVERADDLVLNKILINDKGDTLKILSGEYIQSITPVLPANVTITSGEFNGLMTVQLKDAFLDDPKAFKNVYVIPLRITASTADSILTGLPATPNPNPYIASNWTVLPKDYTLFGVKFVNPYHGKYLHRGVDITKDASGATLKTTNYRQLYVERDQVVGLVTNGRNKVISDFIGNTVSTKGDYAMQLTVSSDGTVTISPVPGAKFAVTGTGTFAKAAGSGQEWGGEKRDALFLEYRYAEGANTHEVRDTMVFRDRQIVFEQQVITFLK